MNIKEEEV